MRISLLVAALAMIVGCRDSRPTAAKAPATPPAPTAPEKPATSDDRLIAVSRLYDRADYAGAASGAEAILRDEPGNIRALRIAISSYCALGDGDHARPLCARLPPKDQEQMTRRCESYGITLP